MISYAMETVSVSSIRTALIVNPEYHKFLVFPNYSNYINELNLHNSRSSFKLQIIISCIPAML
jgi:hypothetical protein